MFIVGIAFAACGMAAADKVEIPIKHGSVEHFVKRVWPGLEHGLLPKAEVVFVKNLDAGPKKGQMFVFEDVPRNTLVLEGADDLVKPTADVISYFNVVPMKIQVEFRMDSSLENVPFTSSTVIDNNSTWTTAVKPQEYSASIRPRINNDGTVTIFLGLTNDGKENSVVVRVKNGQAADVQVKQADASQGDVSFHIVAKIVETAR